MTILGDLGDLWFYNFQIFHGGADPCSTSHYQSRVEFICLFLMQIQAFVYVLSLPNHAFRDSPSIENWLLMGFPSPRELCIHSNKFFSVLYCYV